MPIYRRPDEDEEIINPNEDIVVEDTASPEEKTWAKRYGDLRRLLANKERDWQSKFEDQAVRLQNSSAMSVPAADDESAIEQWVQEHPQIARIVMGIADKRAQAATADVNARVEQLNKDKAQLEVQTAYRKVDEAHPDFFDTIRHQDDFHQWLGQKSSVLQNAIYGNDNDWKSAIDVISLYKAENGKGATKKKTSQIPPAAEYIPSKPTSTPTTGGQIKWKESDIARMSGTEYDKYEEQIADAWKRGEVLMDVSGGAR